jgi:hypothetical protein
MLVKALVRAFHYHKLLEQGRSSSTSEVVAAGKIERKHLGTLQRLTLLVPDLLTAILDWRRPEGVTLPGLLEGVPVGWGEQRESLSF